MRQFYLFAFLASSAAAQTSAPLAFEVASVKINRQFQPDNRATWSNSIEVHDGSLTMRNVSLTMMVAWAYDVQRPRVAALEGSNSQRYEVQAKAGRLAPESELKQMLQALLAERFHLTVHRENRTMEVLAIVVPKGGHKMTPSKVEGPTRNRVDPARGNIVEGATMAELASEMSREMEMPLVDLTGLQGRWDFSFNIQRYLMDLRARMTPETRPPTEDAAKLMVIQEALAGELGLRAEVRKTPVEVVVIDHADKSPVEN
jgi:uncharacterized protein (TIGR03435 family)